ncbi:hypothetical protein [Neobacillus cucumis]|uniref:hypothetical protein n=1 Tax=Neobacillus cucumis TaxID=1740721 RepID=UPI0019663A37|nr:hypothetical protein [Neobacillus cucumis]MBM7651136.1 hypothetical protein [Neobacillus cucumis]
MEGRFGQGKQEIAKDCPNGGQIRTGQAGKLVGLSEWRADLDRTSRKTSRIVRKEGRFGQDQ